LVNPTNPKAVGAGGQQGQLRVGSGDTEAGVKKWMARLESALKGVNPAPVVVHAESQDANSPQIRIELHIEGFRAAAGTAAVDAAA
jgi:hypothetical protein